VHKGEDFDGGDPLQDWLISEVEIDGNCRSTILKATSCVIKFLQKDVNQKGAIMSRKLAELLTLH
jgi:hypothetical protein